MWLYERLQEINLSVADFAIAVDRSEQTIRHWIYTLKKVPWRLEDIEDWQRLANALDWSILDVMRAAGWTFPTDNASIDMQRILARVQRLDDDERAIVTRFIEGLLDVAEQDDITDLPLGD